jgi:hypothetical protein
VAKGTITKYKDDLVRRGLIREVEGEMVWTLEGQQWVE